MAVVKKDLGDFVKAPVNTSSQLISEGRITRSKRPTQITFRLPEAQVDWLERRVNGNKNYVVAKILEKAMKELNEKLGQGEFDIDDY